MEFFLAKSKSVLLVYYASTQGGEGERATHGKILAVVP